MFAHVTMSRLVLPLCDKWMHNNMPSAEEIETGISLHAVCIWPGRKQVLISFWSRWVGQGLVTL